MSAIPGLHVALGLIAIVVLALPARAGVLVVDAAGGAGAFTEIQSAVDAAVDGDVILLESGVYHSFVVTAKALQIVEDAGADARVFGSLVVEGLAPGQSLVLRGLIVSGQPMFPGSTQFLDNAGSIWVEDCELKNTGQHDGVRVQGCAAVSFLRCTLRGGPSPNPVPSGDLPTAGLDAIGSTVALYDCELHGGLGAFGGHTGGPGARLTGGTCFASGCAFVGAPGGKGIQVCTGGECTCSDGGDGGPGLELFALEPRAVELGCTFEGGPAGGVADPVNCVPGASGVPMQTESGQLQSLAGPPRHFACASPVRERSLVVLDFAGEPGDVAFVLTSADPAHLPMVAGVLLVAHPVVIVALGTVSASGTVSATLPVGALPAGVDELEVFLQAGLIDALGQRRLAPASALVVLGSAFDG